MGRRFGYKWMPDPMIAKSGYWVRDEEVIRFFNDALAYIFMGAPIVLVHGDAPGEKMLVNQWIKSNPNCREEAYPAEWDKYGKSAGFRRNAEMLEKSKPDLGVSFPGGKGTAMMVDLMKKADLTVLELTLEENFSASSE